MEITKDSDIEDMLKQYPSLVRVFIAHGLPCLVCGNPFWGTVGELCEKNSADCSILIKKLNEERLKIDEKK
jgi:predicted DNA-binding ribbon-helix-helix protein